MTQTITRLYDGAERAQAAAHELGHNRIFMFDDVHVIASADGAVDALMRVMVLKSHAQILAEGIRRGGAVVVVHAPFGCAGEAINILDSHGPIESGLPDDRDPPLVWDDAAPLSSALHLRVLIDDADTFSKFWGIKAISRTGRTTSSALGLPELKDTRAPMTSSFGLPLLSNNPAPLSSMLGLPLLKGARR